MCHSIWNTFGCFSSVLPYMLCNNPTSHSLSVFLAGKTDRVDISSGNNFWTYDPYALRWQQHHTTGHVPPAEQACALTYANGNAYVLVMEEVHNTGLQLYELDLQRWVWRRLPASDIPFFMILLRMVETP